MLRLASKPVSGNYVKLVFRATKYTGCDALSFRDAVNRKLRENPYFSVVNPATTVRATNTAYTDSERDEIFTDALVIMLLTTSETPTYEVILEPLQNFIGGAWSCVGVNGGIRLVDANVAAYESAPKIRSTGEAVKEANADTPQAPPDETLWTIRLVGYTALALVGVYFFLQVKPFLPKKKG